MPGLLTSNRLCRIYYSLESLMPRLSKIEIVDKFEEITYSFRTSDLYTINLLQIIFKVYEELEEIDRKYEFIYVLLKMTNRDQEGKIIMPIL